MSDDPIADRIEERVANIKNGDPKEQVSDPEHEQARAERSRRAQARQERERAQHEAVRREALQRMHGSTRGGSKRKKQDPQSDRAAADPEGSKQVATATKPKKSTAKKSTKKSTTKSTPVKKQPAKATAAKSNGHEIDLSGKLPFTITWTEPATMGGAEHTRGYWRGARLDIKAFLEDEGKMSDDDIAEGLKRSADLLRTGKGSKIGSVTITVNK